MVFNFSKQKKLKYNGAILQISEDDFQPRILYPVKLASKRAGQL